MAEAKRSPAITGDRFKGAEYERNEWVIDCEQGHTLKDVLDTAYWVHIASQLKPYDHIEARAEDGSWVALLIVLAVDRTWAQVQTIWEVQLTTTDVSLSQAAKHEAAWKGPHRKWAAIRLSDREIIKDSMNSRQEANAWIVEHERATAGV